MIIIRYFFSRGGRSFEKSVSAHFRAFGLSCNSVARGRFFERGFFGFPRHRWLTFDWAEGFYCALRAIQMCPRPSCRRRWRGNFQNHHRWWSTCGGSNCHSYGWSAGFPPFSLGTLRTSASGISLRFCRRFWLSQSTGECSAIYEALARLLHYGYIRCSGAKLAAREFWRAVGRTCCAGQVGP